MRLSAGPPTADQLAAGRGRLRSVAASPAAATAPPSIPTPSMPGHSFHRRVTSGDLQNAMAKLRASTPQLTAAAAASGAAVHAAALSERARALSFGQGGESSGGESW